MRFANRVLLTVPHRGTVTYAYHLSVLKAFFHDRKDRNVLLGEEGYHGLYVEMNRNALVRSFLEMEAEWMMTIDSDHAFKATDIYGLLDVADPVARPVVSGLYFGYMGETDLPEPVPMWFNLDENKALITVAEARDVPQRIDACGMGFCLIHRSVFEKFPNPDDEWRWFGRDPFVVDGKKKYMGEDYTFCLRCRDLGIPVWGHGGVIVDHFKTRKLNLATYMAESPLPK